MNERIEQKYLDKKVDEWQSEHLDFRGVAQTARYFYNLALADVKREIVGRKGVNEYLGREGYIEEDLLILDFIDNLTK